MEIKIIAVGNLKEKYWKEASNEYVLRLSKYTKVQIIEIDEAKVSSETGAYLEKAKDEEGQRILKKIKANEQVVLLDLEGQKLNSLELAKQIEQIFIKTSTVVFVVGGSYGVSQAVKQRADLIMSFSNLTFPHQLFRVILLEQLYRSFKIINNEKYHK